MGRLIAPLWALGKFILTLLIKLGAEWLLSKIKGEKPKREESKTMVTNSDPVLVDRVADKLTITPDALNVALRAARQKVVYARGGVASDVELVDDLAHELSQTPTDVQAALVAARTKLEDIPETRPSAARAVAGAIDVARVRHYAILFLMGLVLAAVMTYISMYIWGWACGLTILVLTVLVGRKNTRRES